MSKKQPVDPSGMLKRSGFSELAEKIHSNDQSAQLHAAKQSEPASKFLRTNQKDAGPEYKDQMRTVKRMRQSHRVPGAVREHYLPQHDAEVVVGALQSNGNGRAGPVFKDQVYDRASKPTAGAGSNPDGSDGRHHQIVDTDEVSPDSVLDPTFLEYKDQVRPNRRHEQLQDKDSNPGAHSEHVEGGSTSTEVLAESNGPALISAHVVNENTIFEAEPMEGGFFCKRRTLFVGLLLLLVIAAAVGGVCASGSCERRVVQLTAPPVESTTSPPATPPGTIPPTTAPSLGSDAISIIDFINNITFNSDYVTYQAVSTSTVTTPEEKAALWLITTDPLELSSKSDGDRIRLKQRFSLLTLWYSMKGDEWIRNQWLEDEDECDWFGVTCENAAVTELQLDSNNLAGSIPPDVALLSSLSKISFINNPGLSGELPTSIGSLTLLEEFYLRSCSVNGRLPSTVGAWTNLYGLDLFENDFHGKLPSSIGSWTSLFSADLASNSFTGSLPESMQNWTDLVHINFSENKLSGTIPEWISSWTRAMQIQLMFNNFTGPIPNSLSLLTTLEICNLIGNALTGSIPGSFGELTSLFVMAVGSNNLTGALPESIGQWKNILSVSFADNNFTSTLPSSIGNWSSLEVFIAWYNNLSGTLPESIGQWNRLEEFHIADNHFNGTLPETIGQWKKVMNVDFDMNSFSGTIPQSIANWTLVETVYLQNNSFTGSVPSGICSSAPKLVALEADCQLSCTCCTYCE